MPPRYVLLLQHIGSVPSWAERHMFDLHNVSKYVWAQTIHEFMMGIIPTAVEKMKQRDQGLAATRGTSNDVS